MQKELDKAIISLVSKDIPLLERPFENLARIAGIEEKILISRLKAYKKNGLMRKFSAALNHRKIGFKHNAMVVWNIADNHAAQAGTLMASFFQVSHCYQRRRAPGWNYNLYSMIHGRTKEECFKTVREISRKLGSCDYRILFSSKEYKKSAANYQ